MSQNQTTAMQSSVRKAFGGEVVALADKIPSPRTRATVTEPGSPHARVKALDIDPKKLLYFATVVEHGSLNQASQALNIAQPSLSDAIGRLERAIGARLLERTARGIAPTSLGEMLYGHARLIRDEIDLVREGILSPQDSPGKLIRIGALPSLSGTIVPLSLSRWRKSFPDLQLQVVETPQLELITGLLRRDFDFVVGLTEVFDIEEGLRQQVLFRDLLCVNARPEHPLVGRRDLSWHDLVQYRWVAATSRWKHTILGQVLNAMNVGPPEHITVCGSLSLMKSMVSASDCLALLPAHASKAERDEGRLVALPFEDPILRRDIAAFFREGYELDQPRRELLSIIKQYGIELSRERPEPLLTAAG